MTVKLIRAWENGPDGLSREEVFASESQEVREINVTVPDGSTDLEIACAFEVAQLQAMHIEANYALTLETNSISASSGPGGGDVLALAAGQARQWSAADALDDTDDLCPFTENVTVLYATNSSGNDAALKIRLVLDPTP